MTSKLEVILPTGNVSLSDRDHYIHLANSDFGMAPVQRLTQRGPLQHGQFDVGFRLQPRNIKLILRLLADDEDDYYDRRDELLRLFAPRETPIALRFTYGSANQRVRQIDVHFKDDLAFSSNDRAYFTHKVGISLEAPDPT